MSETTLNVRIECSGKPYGTHVFNADTGEEIMNVVRVEIVIDTANMGIPETVIELLEGGSIKSTINNLKKG